MSGVILEPFTSIEAAERNFSRLNEAVVALQGGSIAIENIEGYENLATQNDLAEAIETVQYAVGDIHITEDVSDPAQKFGYGEWLLISKGRTLVGIDVAPTDEPDYVVDQDFQTVGQEGGEKQVTLTIAQMPAHTHIVEYGHSYAGTPSGNMSSGDDMTSTVAGTRDSRTTGGDLPHNNLQPYHCVYMWRRTA